MLKISAINALLISETLYAQKIKKNSVLKALFKLCSLNKLPI